MVALLSVLRGSMVIRAHTTLPHVQAHVSQGTTVQKERAFRIHAPAASLCQPQGRQARKVVCHAHQARSNLSKANRRAYPAHPEPSPQVSAHSSASRVRRADSVRAKVQRVCVKRFRRVLLARTIHSTAHQAVGLVCSVLWVRRIPSRAVIILMFVSTACLEALLADLGTANAICARWAGIRMPTAQPLVQTVPVATTARLGRQRHDLGALSPLPAATSISETYILDSRAFGSPGGTFGNRTRLGSALECTAVGRGFWAPVGTSLPISCPASGFYCPGAALDDQFGGARPLLIPVGRRTQTTEVGVVRKMMTLNMAFSDYNETMVRHRLGVLYEIPAHLIEISDLSYTTRRRQLAAGVMFTITIAPGLEDSNALVNLVAAITAINDTRLSASLGVDLTSTAAAQTTRLVVAESECPPGHWCSAGYTTACRVGFFNPNANVDSAAGCQRCPLYASGPVAAVNVSQCTCTNGFVPSLLNGLDKSGGFTCICPAGTEKRGDAQGNVFCGKCMSGMYKEDPNGQDAVCVACQQDDAVGPVGATSANECGCPAGKYMQPDDATCQSCPRGAQYANNHRTSVFGQKITLFREETHAELSTTHRAAGVLRRRS